MTRTPYLLLPFAMFCSFVLGYGQSSWQVSVGLEHQEGRNTISRKAQPLQSTIVQLSFARIVSFDKMEVILMIHGGWQHLRGSGQAIMFPSSLGIKEELEVKNLRFGPSLLLVFGKHRKYRPLLGAKAFVGIPLQAGYEMDNVEQYPFVGLPLRVTATGGGGTMTGVQFFTGFEKVLAPQSICRLQLGVGQHYQAASWEFNAPIFSGLAMANGGFWLGNVAFVHRW